jgi:hypothetical protein
MATRICSAAVLIVLVCSPAFAQTDDEAERYAAAVKVMNASGLREQFPQMVATMLEGISKQLTSKQSDGTTCNADFVAEWKKRFSARLSFDQVMDAVATVYAKHFTLRELNEISDLRAAVSQGKTPQPSQALQDKLQKEGIAVQSEAMGATTQMGARFGGEVARDIGREHPDWCSRDGNSGVK